MPQTTFSTNDIKRDFDPLLKQELQIPETYDRIKRILLNFDFKMVGRIITSNVYDIPDEFQRLHDRCAQIIKSGPRKDQPCNVLIGYDNYNVDVWVDNSIAHDHPPLCRKHDNLVNIEAAKPSYYRRVDKFKQWATANNIWQQVYQRLKEEIVDVVSKYKN